MAVLLVVSVVLLAMSSRGAGQVTLTSGGLTVDVHEASGLFQLAVDGEVWLDGGGSSTAFESASGAPLDGMTIVSVTNSSGVDSRGSYMATTMEWNGQHLPRIQTTFTAYTEHELIVFTQSFPDGYTQQPTPPSPAPVPPSVCSSVLMNTDQEGGQLMVRIQNSSELDCCHRCIGLDNCSAWVTSTDTPPICYLINGTVRGTKSSTNRNVGLVRTSASPFIASFPSFATSTSIDLGFLSWAGCQVQIPLSGSWNSSNTLDFNGIDSGEPILIHKYIQNGRAIGIAPMKNFFTSGQATLSNVVECGIRNSVTSLPAGFNHSTAFVGGHGVNSTMFRLGDVLLSSSGKARTDPYADFVLSHFGYWTDNGAYYYHIHPNFTNAEEALLAVKADLQNRSIPVRYFQWDDWWMESAGDVPGILSWEPYNKTFPSGFTDWLGLPLSLYAPEYDYANVWNESYKWKTDGRSSIPVDPQFYKDLFKNGTGIGMKMFEQDFLCTINRGQLTSTDVSSGELWMAGMNQAALEHDVSLQWCMMNSNHVLASTQYSRVTNGRATQDNCRQGAEAIHSMGPNGLLYYSMGFFPSRDNVWTTPAEVVQPGCNRVCFEANRHADNAVAVLGGGPYGPSDAIGYTDKNFIMRACRDDGVLLRSKWPLSSLDITFTSTPDSPSSGLLLWAAHDDFGLLRWSYIMLVNSAVSVSINSAQLQGPQSNDLAFWEVNTSKAVASVTRVQKGGVFTIPAPTAVTGGPALSHYNAAPVFPSGLVLLGDVSKWAPMSYRRFNSMNVTQTNVYVDVVGTKSETVVVSYVPAGSEVVKQVVCDFSSSSCSQPNQFNDVDCLKTLMCDASSCLCSTKRMF